MNKINFKNLPDKTTPLNASNLNALQQNIEDAITESETAINQTITTLENNKLDKTSKATSYEVIAGTDDTKYTTSASVKIAIDKALEGIETLLSEV